LVQQSVFGNVLGPNGVTASLNCQISLLIEPVHCALNDTSDNVVIDAAGRAAKNCEQFWIDALVLYIHVRIAACRSYAPPVCVRRTRNPSCAAPGCQHESPYSCVTACVVPPYTMVNPYTGCGCASATKSSTAYLSDTLTVLAGIVGPIPFHANVNPDCSISRMPESHCSK